MKLISDCPNCGCSYCWYSNTLISPDCPRCGYDVTGTNARAEKNLHWCARHGDIKRARKLLEGPSFGLLRPDPDARNAGGLTPLMNAAQAGNVEISKILLDHGANVNAKTNNGETALLLAARATVLFLEAQAGNIIDVIDVLLKHGADINAKDFAGWTALHFATSARANIKLIKYLLSKGIDKNIRENGGRTAEDFARARDNTEALEIIKYSVNQKQEEIKKKKTVVTITEYNITADEVNKLSENGFTIGSYPKTGGDHNI